MFHGPELFADGTHIQPIKLIGHSIQGAQGESQPVAGKSTDSGKGSGQAANCRGKTGDLCQGSARARVGRGFHGQGPVSKRLSPEEAEIIGQWIENRRRVEGTLKEMMQVSEGAFPMLLHKPAKRR